MPLRVENYDGLEEAARALGNSRSARFLGGGTLVMRAANAGSPAFDTIIRASDPSLTSIRIEGDAVTIGAGTTMSQIIAHRDTAFLAPVARVVGGPAVRNMATIGGNLFARAPFGDFTAALLALDALVLFVDQSRGLPLEEFLRDRARNMTRLVRAISVPRPREAGGFRFVKVSRVKPKGASVLSIAAHIPLSGGRIQGARIAYAAMTTTPIRATAAERALEGRNLDAATIAEAARLACEGIDPLTDALASAWYRREVVGVHLGRLLAAERR